MPNIINVILCIAFLLLWVLVIRKFVINMYSPVKTVKAEVFDKYILNTASKYPTIFKRGHYIVVFKTGGEKLSFTVSEFSYDNYRINENGTLKYKGNQLISFGRGQK